MLIYVDENDSNALARQIKAGTIGLAEVPAIMFPKVCGRPQVTRITIQEFLKKGTPEQIEERLNSTVAHINKNLGQVCHPLYEFIKTCYKRGQHTQLVENLIENNTHKFSQHLLTYWNTTDREMFGDCVTVGLTKSFSSLSKSPKRFLELLEATYPSNDDNRWTHNRLNQNYPSKPPQEVLNLIDSSKLITWCTKNVSTNKPTTSWSGGSKERNHRTVARHYPSELSAALLLMI